MKAKVKVKAAAMAWLDLWKQQHPDKPVVRNKRATYLGVKVPTRNNKIVTIGKSISSTWGAVSNPSPRKPGLWGWHKA